MTGSLVVKFCCICYRSIWPGNMFGQSSDDDIITLLNMYCGGLAEKKTGRMRKKLLFIPPANFVCGGYTVFTLSVHASVHNVFFGK